MSVVRARIAVACALALVFACAATPPAGAAAQRDAYANAAFSTPLGSALQRFYARDFSRAQADFERALAIAPDNTLAISFLSAAAAQQPGALETLTNVAEDAVSGAPKSYVDHVRLGFAYLFQSVSGRDRTQDARDEFNAALALDAGRAAAHDGLGIMRFNDRSANRAKTEFLAALRNDPSDVLAREYLGELYQTDLRDPGRGLAYVIDVPNLVPQYADIDFHIGSLLSDLHQDDEAVRYLQRGLALDASHVGEAGLHGNTLLARIYIGQRRYADATKELDAAIGAGVDTIYARTLLARLKNGAYASPAPSATPT